MKKNNKGFTMIELLATIVILGILTGFAFNTYFRYITSTREKAYDTLASSAISATESYLMDHPTATQVDFNTLVENEYLETTKDPGNKEGTCRGVVRITKEVGDLNKLDKNDFTVNLCCSLKNITYTKDGKTETSTCNA